MHFEASWAVFWSLSFYKEPKLTIKPFIGCTLGCLLSQKQNISLWSSGMHRKQNFDFYFSLSLLPSFVAFLASFFPCAVHLVGFILVGKVFGKAFRILGWDEGKGRWIVEQDFHEKFQVIVTGFLPFSPVSFTEWGSSWYGLKKLSTLHKLADKNWWCHKQYTGKGRGSAWVVTGVQGQMG